jgi:hypothetical protein
MPFCTTCGASVSGAFCDQCRTPADAAAQVRSAPAIPDPRQIASGDPSAQRKISPALSIVLGGLVLGGIGAAGVAGWIAHRAGQAGVARDREHTGAISFQARGAGGNDARAEIATSVGQLPSWVPVYPGSEGTAAFAVGGTGNGEGESGNFTFTTSDDGVRVKSFYTNKCKDLGMEVSTDKTTPDGGTIIAEAEGGLRRSLTVVIAAHSGQTVVTLTYGLE